MWIDNTMTYKCLSEMWFCQFVLLPLTKFKRKGGRLVVVVVSLVISANLPCQWPSFSSVLHFPSSWKLAFLHCHYQSEHAIIILQVLVQLNYLIVLCCLFCFPQCLEVSRKNRVNQEGKTGVHNVEANCSLMKGLLIQNVFNYVCKTEYPCH